MGPGDQAILVTHQPRWLSDWFWDETACHNLRQLVRGHLKGRARVHLAGQFDHTVAHAHVLPFGMASVQLSSSKAGAVAMQQESGL